MPSSVKPDFLCIGAKKAGTTWLAHNLGQHPDVWMPPAKELHYFNRSERMPNFLYLPLKSAHGRFLRGNVREAYHSPRWLFHYLAFPRTDSWYASLFWPKAGQICGEASPVYAPIPATKIGHIAKILPKVKLIYILREPIERVWSNLKMWLTKHHYQLDSLSDTEVIQHLDRRWHIFSSETIYSEILARWQLYFAADQLHIAFFDQLKADPVPFYTALLRFLDLSTASHLIPQDLHVARNARPARPIPPVIHRWLAARLYAETTALHAHFANAYTAQWLRSAATSLTISTD